ncbi:MAG: PilZ domain-containing protein [Thermodesulfobacteriota bacterium]
MERRKRTRVEGQFTATLLAGEQEFPVETLNLSLKGLWCRAFPGCEDLVGQRCYVHLALARDALIVLEARAVRAEDGRLGVEFLSMPDEESYTHLRNIVRFRAEDPDAIDLEQLTPAFDAGSPGT